VVGYGDQLMATGMARGAAARGKRIAFGDGERILWDHNSEEIFRDNPNIAPPGSEGAHDLEWIRFYRGNRIYNRHDQVTNKWVWNYDFKSTPGEIVFSAEEIRYAETIQSHDILIEPHVQTFKLGAINKQWPFDRYVELSHRLKKDGYRILQLANGASLPYTHTLVKAPSFRHAMAALSKVSLYIGPEGGLHHAAAALGIPGVVIFGGWVPPQVTGYDTHTNIAHGKACGTLTPCPHCFAVLNSISVSKMYQSAKEYLDGR
jgi:glycosyl transferase family 9 (putative heptosyltransferase)